MDQLDLTADSREDVNGGVSNIKLPAQLQKITPAQEFVSVRHRWNTNEEIASILIAFDHHKEWLVLPQKIRPASGSMLLYNRKVVFYRRDGYCWKKRRNGSTIREDHMKLKVQGLECIYGSYVHSAILPTFHRRCYWLLQNPNIVLIHYLNVPYPEAAKPSIRPVSYELRSKEWSKEELVDQLRPMLSRVCEGMEHDVEEDQKVEKMLEEILLILMPMHEGNFSKPVLTKAKSLASQPFGPSPTVGEVSPTPGPSRAHTTTQNWPTQQQVVQAKHVLGIQPQAIHSIIPPVTSSPSISGGSDNLSLDGSESSRSVASVNGGCCRSLVVGAGGQLLSQGLLVGNAAGNSLPQFITLGANQVVMATSDAASSTSLSASLMEASTGGSMGSGKAKSVQILQGQTLSMQPMKTEAAGSPSVPNSCISFQTTNGNNTPVSSSAPGDLHNPSAPLPSSHVSLSQESHSGNHSTTEYLQQAQPQPQQHPQGTQSSAPVLTLHLKPTNSSMSDSPGFVLSLQGATIVSQHSGLPSTSSVSGVLSTSNPPDSAATSSPGGLVLVASQSPGGGLILNKISPQPLSASQGQQGLFTSQLNTAPGAPSGSFSVNNGAPLHNQGSVAQNPPCSAGSFSSGGTGLNLRSCDANSNTYSAGHGQTLSFGACGSGISKNLPLSPSSSIGGSNCITHNSNMSQTLPFGMISSSSNKTGLLTSFSQSSSPKGMINFSQAQNTDIITSSIIDMNQRNLLPDKTFTSTSMFSQQVLSQPQPFIYSSPTTVAMEEIPGHSHTYQTHKFQQQQEERPSHHKTQFETRQQQRFETISPPTVSSTKDPTTDYIFDVMGQGIASGPHSNNKAQHIISPDPPSDGVLASLHGQSGLGGQVGSCFGGHFSKSAPLQGSLFGQENQSQCCHPPHQNTQVSTTELMAGPSGLQSAVKEMITNPSSCDTLDGSFSSLPSADLNLDDLLDLNDLDDVSDLGCSPFTPPDLTHQTAQMDKSTIEAESLTVQGHSTAAHAANLTTFSCTYVSPNHLLQQHQQHQQQQHLHLAVPQPSCPHNDQQKEGYQQAPNSPLHPGAPPRPVHSMMSAPIMSLSSICDTVVAGPCGQTDQAGDPEINSVIKDFSPEWAYVKTNTKVLIAGPWRSETSHYSCVFDGEHIPAMLVQLGLLRCYTQYHNPGYATLQVARDGVIISNCEVFEFCERETSNTGHPEWFAFDASQLKLLLVERLDQLRRRFVHPQSLCQASSPDDLEVPESSLVQQVQAMSGQQLSDVQEFPKAGQHNLTLLHLAAGLGFAKLISCLIRWRMSSDCVALEFDVDAQSVDSHSCTPLTWACALGKIDAALTLYHWNAAPLKMCNKDGLLPLTIARQKGHFNLASQVEQLEVAKEQERQQQQQELDSSTMDLSSSPGQSLSEASPSTISTDVSSTSLPPGSCPAAEEESSIVRSGAVAASFNEKDGAEMKDDDLVEATSVGSLSAQASPFHFSRPAKPGPKLIRRFSEQAMGHQSKTLSKRNSVDLLPSGQSLDQASLPGLGSPSSSPSMETANMLRESNSQSQLLQGGVGDERVEESVGLGEGVGSPDMSDVAFVVPPAPRLMLEEKLDEPSGYPGGDDVTAEETSRAEDTATSNKMDTDESVPQATDSPIIDVERISSDEEVDGNKDGSKHQMVTLANQIIAAIPERIKLSPSKGDDGEEALIGRGRSESHSSLPSQGSPRLSSFGDDSGISTPMTDSLAFDEYRYPELGTPSSSLSPDSTCLPSPYSPYSFTLDSPPPTTAEFTEYFNAPTTYMEKDFSQLTLSDQEQRKLYEAAKVIQNAYRHYRDKQQQKEIEAAILIQSYYRRYKTYAYYKKMSQAAVLIQNQFRTYYARRKKRGDLGVVSRRDSERLKKGRNQSVIIQQRFRSHYQRRSFEGKEGSGQTSGSSEGPDSSPPPAEGRSSPCPDETHPADADLQQQHPVAAGSTDTPAEVDCVCGVEEMTGKNTGSRRWKKQVSTAHSSSGSNRAPTKEGPSSCEKNSAAVYAAEDEEEEKEEVYACQADPRKAAVDAIHATSEASSIDGDLGNTNGKCREEEGGKHKEADGSTAS